jgi:hypothetical protein
MRDEVLRAKLWGRGQAPRWALPESQGMKNMGVNPRREGKTLGG